VERVMSELKEEIEKLAKENGSILEGMSLLVDEINVLSARVDRIENNRHEKASMSTEST
jgi:hypothetical protein